MYLKEQERRYKKDAFKTANWDYDNADDYYTCPNGKKLIFKYNSQRKIRTALRETLEYTNAKIVVIAHTAVSVARPKKAITEK